MSVLVHHRLLHRAVAAANSRNFLQNVSRRRQDVQASVVRSFQSNNELNRNVGRLFLASSSSNFSTSSNQNKSSHSKVVSSASEALQDVDLMGATICVGGFGLGGNPETLLNEIARGNDRARDLTIASLTGGVDGFGIGKLIDGGQVKRLISSYVGENKTLEAAFFGGTLEVELTPQGTLAQRMKAAGHGIPAFYSPTGAGTVYANGGIPIKFKQGTTTSPPEVEIESQPKPTEIFDGHEYVLERALHGDVALVKAWKADTHGNLIFRGTARNANPGEKTRLEYIRSWWIEGDSGFVTFEVAAASS
jgi:acyl CoA:acetate/3-ketoacid CoA transferase alpha subunit